MDNDVSKLENNEVIKCINNNSFVIDINTLKAPLFMYNNYKPVKDNNGNVNQIEEKTYKWVDSKFQSRELYMYCKGRLPRQFESDTLHGLLGLFVQKYAPFPFNKETRQYEVNIDRLEFSWYELCKFMNVPSTGYYINRLKEAIRIMKQTQYFSYENGVLYDKSNKKYINSGEEGLSLITKYKFKTSKAVAENDEYSVDIDNNFIIFDNLIINNLRYEYFKYLDAKMFFDMIPSGIERGIYGFLEANRYDETNKPLLYIKRSFEALRIGIPVDFKYASELKNKLKKPLNHLKEIMYLKDWAFGDDLKVNGNKESCVYFCFGITTTELKKMLEKKKIKQLSFTYGIDESENDADVSKSKNEYLKLPSKSLYEELVDRKVDSEFAKKVAATKDKWTIIKYILWVDKQVHMKKVKEENTGAVLGFALRRDEELPLSNEYKDIIDFVESEKLKSEESIEDKMKKISELYQQYIQTEVDNFIATGEGQSIKDLILSGLNERIDSIIQQNKTIGNDVSKYENFKIQQEESEYFKEMFAKEVRMFKGLMSEQEFTQKIMMNKE